MKEGQWLTTVDSELQISEVSWLDTQLTAYNMTVGQSHTYTVGDEQIWVHNKCGDTNSDNANQALNKAKKENDIPKSQQPDKTIKPNTPDGIDKKLDDRNIVQYEYTNNKGEKVIIRQDKPAKYGEGGKGDQGLHFNAGKKGENLKQHHYYKDNNG